MASLWTPENWPERLNELAARDFEGKQAPLRRDIRSLGMLLGEVLREQAGDELFERVEALRKIAIARREAEGAEDSVRAGAEMEEALALTREVAADPVQAYRLARAFASYFELINLAETNHRKRRRRAALLAEGDKVQPGSVQRGSLRGTLRRLREGGSTREDVLALLERVRIFPVFTAHPTEVARRSVMFKRRRISDLLEQLDAVAVPPSQLGALQDALLAEITALWQTDDVRSARPTVRDEVRMALDYYESAIFATVPVLYAEIAAALQAEFPLDVETPLTAIPIPLTALPVVVRFGSWIGGDRDGNPFVTAAVTQDALQASRELLYGHYLARLSEAFDQLGSSTNQASLSDALTDSAGRVSASAAPWGCRDVPAAAGSRTAAPGLHHTAAGRCPACKHAAQLAGAAGCGLATVPARCGAARGSDAAAGFAEREPWQAARGALDRATVAGGADVWAAPADAGREAACAGA